MTSFNSTTGSIFPPTIYQRILDCYAEQISNQHLDRDQTEGLMTCALVCSWFRQHCQAILFERIHDFNPAAPNAESHLSRLQGINDNNNSLLSQVRELSIVIDPPAQATHDLVWTDDLNTLHPPYAVLLKFPNLRSLSIRDLKYGAIPLGRLASLSREMINAYASQQTLFYLDVGAVMEAECWPALIASSTLQYLTCRSILSYPQQPIAIINRSVKHLKLVSLTLFDTQVSIIANFAALEVLEIDQCPVVINRRLIVDGANAEWVLPPHLKEINMVPSGYKDQMLLLKSLVSNIKRLSQERSNLRDLTKLRAPVDSDGDLTILVSLLEYTPSLRDLDVTVKTQLVLDNPQLMKRISSEIVRAKFPLTHLTIKLEACYPFQDTYTLLMSDIIALVNSLSESTNILATLSIDITMGLSNPHQLSLESWGHIAEHLADAEAFPLLRDVNIGIVGEVAGTDTMARLLQALGGQQGLSMLLGDVMGKLVGREGVLTRFNICLRESFDEY